MSAPIDHLDTSPSETVRRHAATFRKVRAARLEAAGDGPSDELSDEDRSSEVAVAQRDALSDEVPPSAAKLAKLIRERGFVPRVTYSRTSEGVDAVVACAQLGSDAVWAYWRKRRWVGGVAVSDGRLASPTLGGVRAFTDGGGLSDEEREGWRCREFERLVVAELSDRPAPGRCPLRSNPLE